MHHKLLRFSLILLLILLSGASVVAFLSHQGRLSTASNLSSPQGYTQTVETQKAKLITSQSTGTIAISDTVILGGDIMLSRSIGYQNKKQGYGRIFASGNFHPLAAIPAFASGKALLLFNLESQFSPKDNDILDGGFIFRANTGNIAVLDSLRGKNTMVVSLANNHVNNAGGLGMETTRNILDQHHIFHVGGGNSAEEAGEILRFQHNGIRRCIGGYSYDGNGGTYAGKPLYRNKIDLGSMLKDLTAMQGNCDIKTMILHRGAEYRMKPNKDQVRIAHALVDSGLDILVGMHSHVPGHIELYKNKYIFYSLGNALFDQDRGATSVGKGMDTIYDAQLQKNTVPTYIALFPQLIVEKATTGFNITLETFHAARIQKGVYTLLDEETKNNLVNAIYQQ